MFWQCYTEVIYYYSSSIKLRCLKTPVTIFSGIFHVCNCTTLTRTLWVREKTHYSVSTSIRQWEIKKGHANWWKCNNTFPEHLPHMKNVTRDFINWGLCLCTVTRSSDQSCSPQNKTSITSCGKESCSSGFSPLSKITFPCGKCFLEIPTDCIDQVFFIASWLLQSTLIWTWSTISPNKSCVSSSWIRCNYSHVH